MTNDAPLKTPCTRCGALILPTTAARTGGLCRPCQHRQALRLSPSAQRQFDRTWSDLVDIGWIEDLPSDGARQSLRDSLRGHFGESNSHDPTCLATVFLPAECIEDKGDYVRVVQLLARGSYGRFAPELVSDAFDLDARTACVTFRLGRSGHSIELPFEDDYPHPLLFDRVNAALAAIGEERRFFLICAPDVDGVHLCFVRPSVWERAIGADLVPAPS